VRGTTAALLLVVAAALLPTAVGQVFLRTPIEQSMGTVYKIFYFHVPLAWIMMLFAVISGVAAGIQIRRASHRAEAVALSSAEIVLLTGLGVLLTGPIWGHATWGRAWTWDARQVSTALLWLVFVAYVLVRRYGAVGSERLAAALAVFGAADVPIIYYAVKIWKTTHPKTDVVPSLPSTMSSSLWLSVAALLAVAVALFVVRMRQELAAQALDEAWIRFGERSGREGGAT